MGPTPALAAHATPAPQRLSPDSASLQGPARLAIGARGDEFAAWQLRFEKGWQAAGRPATSRRFGALGALALGEETVDREMPSPLAYGNRVLALTQREGKRTCGGSASSFELVARTGGVGGGLRRSQRVATILSHQLPPPLAFAGTARGVALAAWVEYPRDRRGRWSAPRPISAPAARVDALRAAIAPNGAAWLLWSNVAFSGGSEPEGRSRP